MTSTPSGAHLTDLVLLELVDGRGAAAERAEWLAHVEGCAECGRALGELRRTSALVSGAVARIQLPSEFRLEPPAQLDGGAARVVPLRPDAGGARPVAVPAWWRSAAVLVLLLVPLVVVQPLRAGVTGWLADRWAQVSSLFVDDEAPAAAIAEDGSTIYFDAAGPDLDIRFDAPQTAGTLSLSVAPGEQVSFEITADPADEAPVVGGGGLRVRNGAGSAASYAVGVPPTIERVHVRVGDGPVSRFRVGGADWQRVVPVR